MRGGEADAARAASRALLRVLRVTLESLDGRIAGGGEAPLLASGCEIFELNELTFQQSVELLAFHVDLIGCFLNQ